MPPSSRRKRVPLQRGLSIYRKPDSPYWWIDCHFANRRHRINSHHELRREAEAAAWAFIDELDANAGRPGRGEGDDLAALAAADRAEAVARGVGKRQLESIENSWMHLCRLLGAETAPRQITYDTALRYIAARRDEDVRGQSITKEIQALKRGLKIARRRGSIRALPEEWPRVRHDPPRKGQRGALHPQSVIVAWLKHLRAHHPRSARQATVAVLTGLRATELRRVCWEWVEPSPPGAGVPALLRIPAEAAKTRRERVVGLVPDALACLDAARIEIGSWSAPLMNGDHKRAFETARIAIGHTQRITLRDLRHCHATWAAQSTGDAAAAQAALGHSDLRTTQRYLSATIARTASAAVGVAHTLAEAPSMQPTPLAHRASNCHGKLSRPPTPTQENENPASAKTLTGSSLSNNGGERTRTDDPLRAKQVLSQLSYAPEGETERVGRG